MSSPWSRKEGPWLMWVVGPFLPPCQICWDQDGRASRQGSLYLLSFNGPPEPPVLASAWARPPEEDRAGRCACCVSSTLTGVAVPHLDLCCLCFSLDSLSCQTAWEKSADQWSNVSAAPGLALDRLVWVRCQEPSLQRWCWLCEGVCPDQGH